MSYVAIPPVPPPPNIPVLPSPTGLTTLTFEGTAFQNDWRGACANYMLRAALPEYGLSPATLATEWARVALSGVKIISTEYLQSLAMPLYPLGSPDGTTADMLGFCAGLQAMKDAGIKVMIKMGWHWPQNVGALTGAAPITPTPANEATFAAWVSWSLDQFINVHGFTNVIGCFFFTEPSTSTIGSIPAGYTSVDYYGHIVTVVRDKIVADDASRTPIRPRIKLSGPSEQTFTTFDWTEYLFDNFGSLFDENAGHSYCTTPGFAPFGFTATECAGYQAWIDRFTDPVTYIAPRPFSADEGGFLVGGDTDSTGYRATADAGWQLCRLIDGHMQAGCVASYIWLLSDQPVLGGTNLQYGVMKWIATDGNLVKPAWYAYSMLANLTGGGGGTKLYRCTGGAATLHGTAAWVPPGVKNATDPRGEWSFVVINESSAANVKINLGQVLPSGRTFYKYSYSGETPPTTAANPAYLLSWGQAFPGITSSIPTNTIPGHSVVVYSTMNISAPTAANLALTAFAETDSAGFGSAANAISGNFSNVLGTANTWRKANDSSHYLQLNWAGTVTLSRIELSFVATTVGVVYATYTDTTTPAPLADYTVQYLLAGVWTDFSTPIAVTGNASPNKTHTFNAVSTNAIRLTATSAAATAGVNQIGVYAV